MKQKQTAFSPRILHLSSARDWRGGERQIFNLACEFQKLGLDQTVCGPSPSVLETKCKSVGIQYISVPMKMDFGLISAWRVKEICRDLGIQIIHAHTGKAHGVGIVAKLLLSDVRLVVTRRVDFKISGWKYKTSLIDRYIAISKNVEKSLIDAGVAKNRIRIAYSGIDLSLKSKPNEAAIRKEFEIKKSDIIIGSVGALVEHKDHITLLRAFSVTVKKLKSKNLRLMIVGRGELLAELEAERDKLGITNTVIFTGFRNNVDDFLAIFDIFAMSSLEEGLGTVLLDAMRFGKSIVATNAGGIPELVIDHLGGLLSPARDPKLMAENFIKLLKSPTMRRQFGAFNKKRVKLFSSASTAKSTLSTYAEVLS